MIFVHTFKDNVWKARSIKSATSIYFGLWNGACKSSVYQEIGQYKKKCEKMISYLVTINIWQLDWRSKRWEFYDQYEEKAETAIYNTQQTSGQSQEFLV